MIKTARDMLPPFDLWWLTGLNVKPDRFTAVTRRLASTSVEAATLTVGDEAL
jgi:hypothetical protein